jgi:hypothetical protein
VASPLLEVGESLKLVCASKSKGTESSINYEGSNRGKGKEGVGFLRWGFGFVLCTFWVFLYL